jgi:hypothetical protein
MNLVLIIFILRFYLLVETFTQLPRKLFVLSRENIFK